MQKGLRVGILVGVSLFFYYSGGWALSNERVAAGLKEALNVGIKEAVKMLGTENGFYKNPDVKILLPEKLRQFDDTVRKFGGGDIADLLVKKMNRAAEQATPKALDIFIGAVKEMNIGDAMEILNGEKHAATAYLRENTSDRLRQSFYPIVKDTMEEINAVKTYNEYIGTLKSNSLKQKAGSLLQSTGLTESGPLSGLTDMEPDINRYVTGEAIEGLFKVLAEQEEKIRTNPKARVTELLEDVFGGMLGR